MTARGRDPRGLPETAPPPARGGRASASGVSLELFGEDELCAYLERRLERRARRRARALGGRANGRQPALPGGGRRAPRRHGSSPLRRRPLASRRQSAAERAPAERAYSPSPPAHLDLPTRTSAGSSTSRRSPGRRSQPSRSPRVSSATSRKSRRFASASPQSGTSSRTCGPVTWPTAASARATASVTRSIVKRSRRRRRRHSAGQLERARRRPSGDRVPPLSG